MNDDLAKRVAEFLESPHVCYPLEEDYNRAMVLVAEIEAGKARNTGNTASGGMDSGRVAQRSEQDAHNVLVDGSNPSSPTTSPASTEEMREVHIIEVEHTLTQEQYDRFRQQCEEQFGAGKFILLEGGAKYSGTTTINTNKEVISSAVLEDLRAALGELKTARMQCMFIPPDEKQMGQIAESIDVAAQRLEKYGDGK